MPSTHQAQRKVCLASFGQDIIAGVIGASGGLGGAFVEIIAESPNVAQVMAFSRSKVKFAGPKVREIAIDLEDEERIGQAAAEAAKLCRPLHIIIVASGILHDSESLQPEKTWDAVSAYAMDRAFRLNATGPALVATHFLPLLAKDRKTAFAALSARVGSIEDNQLGGWHAYRASKAALNMLIKLSPSSSHGATLGRSASVSIRDQSIRPCQNPFREACPKESSSLPIDRHVICYQCWIA